MATMQPIVFKLGEEKYGINIEHVNAIEHDQEIVRVPNSSGNIKGIINLRGEVIPVVNLKAKFNAADQSAADNSQLIIVQNNMRKIAIEVDSVEKIQNLIDNDVVEMPIIAKGEGVDYFSHVAKIDGQLVIMIEPEKLLSQDESSAVDSIVNN